MLFIFIITCSFHSSESYIFCLSKMNNVIRGGVCRRISVCVCAASIFVAKWVQPWQMPCEYAMPMVNVIYSVRVFYVYDACMTNIHF